VLLAVGAIIATAILHQAYTSLRSQQATVAKLMRDHSAVASWHFGRFTTEHLRCFMENLLHATHPPRDRRDGSAPTAAELIEGGSECPMSRGPEARAAMVIRLSDGAIDAAGTWPPPLTPDVVQQALSRELAGAHANERTSMLAFVRAAGRTYPTVYTIRRYREGAFLFAVPLESSDLEPVLAPRPAHEPLLPPALIGDIGAERLLALDITIPGGERLYASMPDFGGDYVAADTLDPRSGGLIVRVGIRPEYAEQLIIGGLPASRVPVLMALLAMTLGLLAVAIAQLRRSHVLARLRSDFVSSVSHELRTPLALQRISLDTIRLGRARDEETRQRAFDNVDRETTRLTHLVDNLLRFNRAEQGRTRFTLAAADISAEVSDVLAGFSRLVEPDGVLIQGSVEPGIVANVDREALRRVLLNLLENAAKYGPRGQTITVGLALNENTAVLIVDDEGPGVPLRERDDVWEPFRRGERAVGTAVAGSGIGLAVVREIVHGHGGSAVIDDAPSGGARFCVTIPGAHRAAAVEGDPHVSDGAPREPAYG
jgi:two-component system phosphate regulon sensor histidine kinase PhoR